MIALIVPAAILLVGGLHFYIDAFQNSTQYSTDAGALRVGLSTAAVGIGCILAAVALASL